MKKICMIFLLFMIISISTLTIYTIKNKAIKEEGAFNTIKNIEKYSSNITQNEYNEIYNIKLNGKRHKLKNTYNVVFQEKIANISLTIYLDGKKITSLNLQNNYKASSTEEIFNNDEPIDLLIEKKDIKIINSDKDYLSILIKTNIDKYKEEYIIINDLGKIILDNILRYESNFNYFNESEENVNIFYDQEKPIQAKIENNKIYSLEKIENKNSLIFEEYIYTLKDNKFKKETINTYKNIYTK